MLTVASYNIHRCIGSDAMYRPGRIVEVLRQLDADVVGLQEVDAHLLYKGGQHQLDYIVEETGYSVVSGTTMMRENAEYGNAILSRIPILRSKKYDLTMNDFEPRGALQADIEVHGRLVKIINVHLGLRYLERRRQIRKLIQIIDREPEIPMVLLGDFNEWIPMIGSTLKLRRRFIHTKGLKTYPALRPLVGLDKVFIDMRRILVKTEVPLNKLTRKASDHLPVKAYLKL